MFASISNIYRIAMSVGRIFTTLFHNFLSLVSGGNVVVICILAFYICNFVNFYPFYKLNHFVPPVCI